MDHRRTQYFTRELDKLLDLVSHRLYIDSNLAFYFCDTDFEWKVSFKSQISYIDNPEHMSHRVVLDWPSAILPIGPGKVGFEAFKQHGLRCSRTYWEF